LSLNKLVKIDNSKNLINNEKNIDKYNVEDIKKINKYNLKIDNYSIAEFYEKLIDILLNSKNNNNIVEEK